MTHLWSSTRRIIAGLRIHRHRWRVMLCAHTGQLNAPAWTWPITSAEPVAWTVTKLGAWRELRRLRDTERIRRRVMAGAGGLRAWYTFRLTRA